MGFRRESIKNQMKITATGDKKQENQNDSHNDSHIKDLNLSEIINEWDNDDLRVI